MNRLALLLAAIGVLAIDPLAHGAAQARDRDDRPSRVERPWPGRPYGSERYGYEGRGRGVYPRPRYDEDRHLPRGRGDERWGPSGYPAPYPRPPGVRPGGYLPPAYRGAFVDDYRRFRLRPPPHGYAWVRIGGGFALVSLEDGQIFDMVR